jgi:Cu/Ag efflux protein CusF
LVEKKTLNKQYVKKGGAMRKLALVLVLSFLFYSSSSLAIAEDMGSATDKPGVFADESINITATVEVIDYQNRLVTVKGPEGNLLTVTADDSVKNFDQIKTGDTVSIDYYASVAIYVRKSDQAPMAEEDDIIETAPLGQKPAAFELKVDEITATVTNIDYDTRSITLKGPQGNEMTFNTSDKVKKFNEIKAGDEVVARVTQALAIAVNKPQ